MKVISIISKHPGCGVTTIVVNLASGLAQKGHRVLIVDLGQSEKLCRWLGINPEPGEAIGSFASRDHIPFQIASSRLGPDFMSFPILLENSPEALVFPAMLEELAYDYLLIHPSNGNLLLKDIAGMVIACTDLSQDKELEELQSLDKKCLQKSTGQSGNINLILPSRINTKEWEHNIQKLFTLADYFGYERIADPIPA